ncbi:hypothetical protein MTP10_27870 [Nonomuraea sp. 3-1Str]|uniref:esterase/lipase family protein n=1 Tax=Nonomuraea sp. 3-1Str TaxID=2929801 RepID=UPI00285637C4|nr:hypothetical protein [Nonomuraea sp. 3-1Str]MDR8412535.1 hypothetical protein [Nonomuraea sp. 3-1Str]
MHRLLRCGLAAIMSSVVAAAALAVTAPPASAAPSRGDGQRVTLLVHGFDREADTNCASSWKNARDLLLANGWTDVRTFGYYNKSTNCDIKFNGTTDTRIQEIGRQLAWTVYSSYSSQGVPVDIMAHSMGGLIAKAAIEGVNRYGVAAAAPDIDAVSMDAQSVGATAVPSGWPPYLYIEDIVTLATPHKGIDTALVDVCSLTHEQCSDMRDGSGFLKWLGAQPPSQMGTDYTFLASSYDDTVAKGSATNGNTAHHWALYTKNADGGTLSHTAMRTTATGEWQASWGGSKTASGSGSTYAPPLVRAMEALFSHEGA